MPSLHHCQRLTDTCATCAHPAATGGAEPPATPARHLPPGTDESIFTEDQLDYLEALYADTMWHHLRQLYRILRAMPPGVEPTCTRVGINAAIFAKLCALTEPLAATTWREFRCTLGASTHTIGAQKRAIIEAIRQLRHS